ncbi:MAG: diguanylate cyclase [Lachnospiraceae bacterium]|nr:diguanylate cyclase [Lachnospiraceae bacterium]
MWTRFVIAYLKANSKFAYALKYAGLLFLLAQWIVVFANLFTPILFTFDENDNYTALNARYISMIIQIVMYLMSSVYLLYAAYTSDGRRRFRRMTVAVFGFIMSAFIILQAFFPMLPFYSAGYLCGTCLLHTFFVEDLKREQMMRLKELLENEVKQRNELAATRHVAYTDALTHVRNKHAYVEVEAELDRKISDKKLKDFGIIVFDLNGLKYVNDTYGHETGDQYLKDACKLICEQFKHSAVFRIGGDEFVALIEGSDYQNIDSLLNDFNKQIEENIAKKSVIISSGFEKYNPETDNSFNSIFVRADKKMYERKHQLKEMGSI